MRLAITQNIKGLSDKLVKRAGPLRVNGNAYREIRNYIEIEYDPSSSCHVVVFILLGILCSQL